MTATRTVVGSGATALACALFAARYGPVSLAARQRPPRPGVESVPAATLTLLLELGITPDQVGVERLHRGRLAAWSHPDPTPGDGPARAHLDTASLITALRHRVAAHPAITVHPRARPVPTPGWIDATGRRALSATTHDRPPRPWTATTVTVPTGHANTELHMAAAADGYGYRLGTAHHLTVGWVGPARTPRSAAHLAARITAAGASWLLADVDLTAHPAVVHRPASAAFPSPSPGTDAVAIGDAALARDALAAQGLSVGLSDACLVADPTTAEMVMQVRRRDGATRHIRQLGTALGECRYRHQACWTDYLDWLDQHARAFEDPRPVGAPTPEPITV